MHPILVLGRDFDDFVVGEEHLVGSGFEGSGLADQEFVEGCPVLAAEEGDHILAAEEDIRMRAAEEDIHIRVAEGDSRIRVAEEGIRIRVVEEGIRNRVAEADIHIRAAGEYIRILAVGEVIPDSADRDQLARVGCFLGECILVLLWVVEEAVPAELRCLEQLLHRNQV